MEKRFFGAGEKVKPSSTIVSLYDLGNRLWGEAEQIRGWLALRCILIPDQLKKQQHQFQFGPEPSNFHPHVYISDLSAERFFRPMQSRT